MKRDLMYKGSFYPEDVESIKNFITDNMDNIEKIEGLKGLIVPHAGWIYSGFTASKGFSHIPKEKVERIYLFGPSHRFHFNGVAISSFDEYETPLGSFKVDKETEKGLLDFPGVGVVDEAHTFEHSLEVELPFLKHIYPDAQLIPIVAGAKSTKILAKILNKTLSEDGALTVISSDLSHYKPYDVAKEIDSNSIKQITSAVEPVDSKSACGSVIINSLIEVVQNSKLEINLINYCNSGDTAGDKESVVGYCSMEILSCG